MEEYSRRRWYRAVSEEGKADLDDTSYIYPEESLEYHDLRSRRGEHKGSAVDVYKPNMFHIPTRVWRSSHEIGSMEWWGRSRKLSWMDQEERSERAIWRASLLGNDPCSRRSVHNWTCVTREDVRMPPYDCWGGLERTIYPRSLDTFQSYF